MQVLSELHDRAPVHSFAETRRVVESELGQPLEALFEEFDPEPLASGSVAQVRPPPRLPPWGHGVGHTALAFGRRRCTALCCAWRMAARGQLPSRSGTPGSPRGSVRTSRRVARGLGSERQLRG